MSGQKNQLTRILPCLLIIGIALAGCSNGNTTAPTDAEVQIPSPTPKEPPTAIPPTPIPTSRSIVDEVELEEGEYKNDLYGISIEYPTSWEVLENSQSEPDLLVIKNSDVSVIVFLSTFLLEEEQTLDDLIQGFVVGLSEGLEIPDFVEVSDDRSSSESKFDVSGVWEADYQEEKFRISIFAHERGGRAFLLTYIGYADNQEFISRILDKIPSTANFYPPAPYGVDRENALFLAGGEPRTIDPAKTQGSAESLIGDLFSGLVRLDASLQPIPDLAERWEVSEDGTVYTFYLRENVTFHDGRPFTAEDVIFSWNRAADPDFESPTVGTYLTDIIGVTQVIEGDAQEISGVRALDDYTLEVTIDAPKVYFLYKLAYPTSWIVDKETVDDIEDHPNGTGPFKLVKHDENEIYILVRNENYHLGFVPLEYVVYLLYQGPTTRLYEAGIVDMLVIDDELLDAANDPESPLFGNVQPSPSLCTTYIVFDQTRPPFDDLLVRQAFAMSIDKDRFNETIYEGKGVMANGLFPPGLPGYNPDVSPMEYDPEKAVEALANSSYGSADAIPEIVFTMSGGASGLSPFYALLIQMWEDTLGVTITVDQLEYQDYRDEVDSGNHGQLLVEGWCADYPDPENFADVLFHSGNPRNSGKYYNPEVDALLEQARTETDWEVRQALYHEIEQNLVDTVAAVFLKHSRTYYIVVKPYVVGYTSGPFGIAQNMNIEIIHDQDE